MGGAEFVGRVVSNRMQKSIVVAVSYAVWVPKYKVYQKRISRIMAHDEQQECVTGDVVRVHVTQKISKNKHYNVTQILRRAHVFDSTAAAQLVQRRDLSQPQDAVAFAEARVVEVSERLAALRRLYEEQLGPGISMSTLGAGSSSSPALLSSGSGLTASSSSGGASSSTSSSSRSDVNAKLKALTSGGPSPATGGSHELYPKYPGLGASSAIAPPDAPGIASDWGANSSSVRSTKRSSGYLGITGPGFGSTRALPSSSSSITDGSGDGDGSSSSGSSTREVPGLREDGGVSDPAGAMDGVNPYAKVRRNGGRQWKAGMRDKLAQWKFGVGRKSR